MISSALPRLIDGLVLQQPLIRIFPGLIMGPFFAALIFLITVIAALIYIPGGAKHLPKIERPLNILIFTNFLLMLMVIFFSSALLDYSMPKLGYVQCDILEGKPSIWFSDWIKNSEWCVKGKSPEWVFEQAGLPGSLAR
jgi:hypothetical protein